ncbi:MAG: hypothetical protein AAF580_12060 [Pseudomonadota bacterium]
MSAYIRFDGLDGESPNVPDVVDDPLAIDNGDGSNSKEGATAASAPVLARMVQGTKDTGGEDSPPFELLSDDAIEFRDDGFDDGFGSGDLLIVNNGDGEWSDPFQEDLPVTPDGDADVDGPFILIGLLLPAVQSEDSLFIA